MEVRNSLACAKPIRRIFSKLRVDVGHITQAKRESLRQRTKFVEAGTSSSESIANTRPWASSEEDTDEQRTGIPVALVLALCVLPAATVSTKYEAGFGSAFHHFW
jgi:hypothetical protein